MIMNNLFSQNPVKEVLEKLKGAASASIESDSLEFKEYTNERALHNAKDLAQEISALANKDGGRIIIGVRDSSNITGNNWSSQLVGFEHIDLITAKDRITGKLKPKIDIHMEQIAFEGKVFIVINVPHRKDTLVTTSSGKVYIRDGRSSRPMPPREIESAVKSLQTYDWSAEVLPDFIPLESIDLKTLQDALNTYRRLRSEKDLSPTISTLNFLEAIGVTKNGIITKGGLLFLGKEDIIRKALGEIEYRFSWKTRSGSLKINNIWTGCIWSALQRAKMHFKKCNRTWDIEYEGKYYKAQLLDEVAFHEAYLNALVHRDYSSDGMVSVNFTGSKLVITSPGSFYGGVTADNIALHEPRHRNKELARILMLFQLVDRAGMGVLRMGIRSLMYGRSFPRFRETIDSVEVTMDAEYLRAPIFVITVDNTDNFGIPELLILNSVFEVGFITVNKIQKQLSKVANDPWQATLDAVKRLGDYVELCGSRSGVYIRVNKDYKDFMKVGKTLKVSPASEKYVQLYCYLKKHETASNEDLTGLLNYSYSSQTSTFLKRTEYVKRTGHGPNAKWLLSDSA